VTLLAFIVTRGDTFANSLIFFQNHKTPANPLPASLRSPLSFPFITLQNGGEGGIRTHGFEVQSVTEVSLLTFFALIYT